MTNEDINGKVASESTTFESKEMSATDTDTDTDNTVLYKFDLIEISKKFVTQTTCYDFLSYLPKITSEEIEHIEQKTRGQHKNDNWHRLHKGRITASKFYQVFTKVQTIKKKNRNNEVVDCTSILKSLLGHTCVNPNLKPLKHGRETEPVAVHCYLDAYKKCHENVAYSECGMFIDKSDIFLAATPDLLISCSCCGEGLLEVKCPLVPECKLCSKFCTCNLPEYIVYLDGEFKLKQNHSYFVQVQGQLAITGRKWCDFYVYTINGPIDR